MRQKERKEIRRIKSRRSKRPVKVSMCCPIRCLDLFRDDPPFVNEYHDFCTHGRFLYGYILLLLLLLFSEKRNR